MKRLLISNLLVITLFFPIAKPPKKDVFTLTNQERTKAHLKPLKENKCLDAAATAKLQDMGAKGYFAHISPDGSRPWDFVNLAHYNYANAGENLAGGYKSDQEVVTAFMGSEGHKANILGNYTEIGIAQNDVLWMGDGKWQGRRITLVVQEFASPMLNVPWGIRGLVGSQTKECK